MQPARAPRSFDAAVYRARRARVAANYLEDGVLVLHCGSLKTRSNDTHYRFRPDSDFYYLTGLAEPEAVMVLRPGSSPSFVLFVQPRSPEAELWNGRRCGPEGAVSIYGADVAYPISELDRRLPALLDGCERLYAPQPRAECLELVLTRAMQHLARRNRYGEHAPHVLEDARRMLGEERILKDAHALRCLRRAAEISCAAHVEAMRTTRPGLFEYELEALLEYHFRRHGSTGPGYTSIVGGGANATILHYIDNCDPLRAGELLLIDAGAEWDFFTADITRTFPVSGRFTPAQRDLYEVVLRANEAGIEQAAPDITIDVIHEHCLRELCSGLRDMGLLRGSVEELIETEAYAPYYMHRTSHWLGADVHDAGLYCVSRKPRPLLPGFVFTIEPGLYVAEDDPDAPEELRGVGIRIEDDVLITEEGAEVLTADVPKRVAELEALVGQAAR